MLVPLLLLELALLLGLGRLDAARPRRLAGVAVPDRRAARRSTSARARATSACHSGRRSAGTAFAACGALGEVALQARALEPRLGRLAARAEVVKSRTAREDGEPDGQRDEEELSHGITPCRRRGPRRCGRRCGRSRRRTRGRGAPARRRRARRSRRTAPASARAAPGRSTRKAVWRWPCSTAAMGSSATSRTTWSASASGMRATRASDGDALGRQDDVVVEGEQHRPPLLRVLAGELARGAELLRAEPARRRRRVLAVAGAVERDEDHLVAERHDVRVARRGPPHAPSRPARSRAGTGRSRPTPRSRRRGCRGRR